MMTEKEDEERKLEEKLKELEDDSGFNQPMETGAIIPDPEKNNKKNLVFDEERFEDTFLKCLICRETFDEDEKIPKMLPCHHTFCLDCLKQMFRVEGEFRRNLTSAFRSMPVAVKISCPTCREGLIASEAEILRLPNDHTVRELIAFVRCTGKTDVAFCKKHQMQPLNFFCEPCIAPVCRDCTVIDHKEKNGHVVMNVEEALYKYVPVLDETLTEMESEEKVLHDKRMALEKASDNLEQIQKELGVQIRQTFDRIRDAIDERERELYSAAEHEIDKKRQEISDQLELALNREETFKSERLKLQNAKDNKNISAMFSNHQSAREALMEKVTVQGPSRSIRDFAVSFQFNSRQENNIRHYISNFGDVTFKNACFDQYTLYQSLTIIIKESFGPRANRVCLINGSDIITIMASAIAESSKVVSPIRKRTASEEATLQSLRTEFDFEQKRKLLKDQRNIIVDEDSFIETFLKCLICRELYDDIERPPKLLHCHHSLCLQCILLIFQKEAEYRKSLTPAYSELPTAVTIICPTCRTNFIITQDGIRELPTDHRVIQLIDFISHTERYTTDFCPQHRFQPINFFCELCSTYICRDCTIVDHQEALGHTVVDFESAIKKYIPVLDKAIKEMDSEKEAIKKKQKAVEDTIENLDKEENRVSDEIKESFAKLRKILEEREQEVLQMAKREVGNEKNKLKEKLSEMEKRTEELDQNINDIQQTKEEGKLENLYKSYRTYSGYRSEPVIKVKEVDEGVVAKFSFSSRDENIISNKLQNYGDVSSYTESVYTRSTPGGTNRSALSEDRYGSSRYSTLNESRYSSGASSSSSAYTSRYSSPYNRYSYRT
ncbi:uncharacterized protein LOC134236373 [Saccostrea cucullata]|uniref:uncharacterized protein LOC134236373 n=1 Tax=Saccostrea cuccullata TaxID=36930 RepID=UPI002ED41197